jgi:ferritin-like metal-binding protein YciE
MKLKSLRDLLADQLKDLYSAENQIIKALPKMAKAASSPELRASFKEHLEQTLGHAERLERACEMLGVTSRGKKCAALEGLVKEGKEPMGEDAEPPVLEAGLIAAAQKVEHYEIAAYGSARTWAEQLGLEEVAALLQEALDEEKATDEKLTRLAEEAVNPPAAAGEDASGARKRAAGGRGGGKGRGPGSGTRLAPDSAGKGPPCQGVGPCLAHPVPRRRGSGARVVRPRRPSVDECLEGVRVQRLGEVPVNARLAAAAGVLLPRHPRHGNQQGPAAAGQSAQPPSEFAAVHAGHHDVQQGDVGRRGRGQPQRGGAVVGSQRLMSPEIEDLGEGVGVVAVVVHDQHAEQALRHGGGRLLWRRGRRWAGACG